MENMDRLIVSNSIKIYASRDLSCKRDVIQTMVEHITTTFESHQQKECLLYNIYNDLIESEEWYKNQEDRIDLNTFKNTNKIFILQCLIELYTIKSIHRDNANKFKYLSGLIDIIYEYNQMDDVECLYLLNFILYTITNKKDNT